MKAPVDANVVRDACVLEPSTAPCRIACVHPRSGTRSAPVATLFDVIGIESEYDMTACRFVVRSAQCLFEYRVRPNGLLHVALKRDFELPAIY
jgi:hypothetical protein